MPIQEVDNPFVVMTSHGSDAFLPYQAVADELFAGQGAGVPSDFLQNPAHRRDASDYAVGEIGSQIARRLDAAVLIGSALGGRLFINVNGSRDRATHGYTLLKTFGGAPVWKIPPSPEVQEEMTKRVWDTYHQSALDTVVQTVLAKPVGQPTLVVDIHDTDTHVFDKYGRLKLQEPVPGKPGFPLVVVSDKKGEAAQSVVTDKLGQRLLDNLVAAGIIDKAEAERRSYNVNNPYQGGYTTQRYGIDLPNAMTISDNPDLSSRANDLHVIQIELNRTGYTDKHRLSQDPVLVKATAEAVAEAIRTTSNDLASLPGIRLPMRRTPWLGTPTHVDAAALLRQITAD